MCYHALLPFPDLRSPPFSRFLFQIFATNDAFRGLTMPMTTLDDGTMVPNFHMRYFTEVGAC